MKLGEILRVARKNKKLTQAEVANQCFVVDVVISNYENNKSVPDIAVLCKLCNALDLSLEELKNGEYINVPDKTLPPIDFDAQKVADALKELRICAGLSQADEASQLFVTPQTISKWENATTVPSFETLCAISDLYGVSVTSIFNGLQRETETMDDVSQKLYYKKRSSRFTKATIILSAVLVMFFVATIVLSVYYVNTNNQYATTQNDMIELNQKLYNIDKEKTQTSLQLQNLNDQYSDLLLINQDLNQKLSDIDKEKTQISLQLQNLNKQYSDLLLINQDLNQKLSDIDKEKTQMSLQLQNLNKQYNDLLLINQDLNETISNMDRDICKITLYTPSGQTETYYIFVGVSTTIKPHDQMESIGWAYYLNGDTTNEAYSTTELTICPENKNDLVFQALPRKSWIDISKAKNAEEKKLFEEINSELREIDNIYVMDLSRAYVELVANDKFIIGECIEAIDRIVVHELNDNHCYVSKVYYHLMQVIDKISYINSLENLCNQLKYAAECCEILVNNMQTYNEAWVIELAQMGPTTLRQKQDFYVSNVLTPYFDKTIPAFIMFLMNFNVNYVYLEDMDEYFEELKNTTLFADLNLYDEMLDWMTSAGLIREE